jgi:hypothetical protein
MPSIFNINTITETIVTNLKFHCNTVIKVLYQGKIDGTSKITCNL